MLLTRNDLPLSCYAYAVGGILLKRVYAILIFLTLLLSACSSYFLEPPEVTLSNIEFSTISIFETGLIATVRFQNPNDVDLRFITGKHRLTLNGVDIGNGYHEGSFTVDAYGSSVQPVTFRVGNLGLLTKIERLIAANQLEYAVTSRMKTSRGSFTVKNSGSVSSIQ